LSHYTCHNTFEVKTRKFGTRTEKCLAIWPKITQLLYARILLHICQIAKPNFVNFLNKTMSFWAVISHTLPYIAIYLKYCTKYAPFGLEELGKQKLTWGGWAAHKLVGIIDIEYIDHASNQKS